MSTAPTISSPTFARQRRLDALIGSTTRLAQRSGKRRPQQIASFIAANAELAMPSVGGELAPIVDRLQPDVEAAALAGPLYNYAATDIVDAELAAIFGKPDGRYDLDEQREAVRKLAVFRYVRQHDASRDLW